MSYYLGLVGVGLLFVLIVHIYNRWTIYKIRKQEQERLFGFNNDPQVNPKSQSSINPVANYTLRTKARNTLQNNHTEISELYESVKISNIDQIPPENINLWVNKIIELPYLATLTLIDKNKHKELIWDLLWQRNPNQVKNNISFMDIKFKLADRSGFFDAKNIKNVRTILTKLINGSQAILEIDEINNIANRAEALDSQCAQFDVQIVITLVCRNQTGVSGGQISKESIAHGMVFEKGSFYKISAEGTNEYKLDLLLTPPAANLEELETRIGQKITLTLDIPKTKDGLTTFKAMSKLAQHLSAAINADIVDDQLQPLSTLAMETIGIQIEQIQKQMITNGFIPGSPDLYRIFSQ